MSFTQRYTTFNTIWNSISSKYPHNVGSLNPKFMQVFEYAQANYDESRGKFGLYAYFLIKSCFRQANKTFTHEIPHSEYDLTLSDEGSGANSVEKAVIVSQVRRTAKRILPKNLLAVFEHAYIDGMSFVDISKKLGISPQAVQQSAVKAVRLIRGELDV